MEKMERIVWIPAYSVGVDILDAQHRKLFDITNRVIDLYESGSTELLPAIRELVDYLAVHFQSEHTVMMDMHYPHFDLHSREHRRFTEKVEEFLKDYQEGNQDLTFKMAIFLKDWISDHTAILDIQYGEYLTKTRTK